MTRGMLHHVEIYVSDLEKSRDFWGWLFDYLGYSLFQKWENGFSYKRGDTYIVFVQTAQKFLDYQYHRCRTGLNHLAFHADDPRDVDELTTKLNRRGISILYADKHPFAGGKDTYAVYFEDPDRIKVEYICSSQ